jgi:hypothetical protein
MIAGGLAAGLMILLDEPEKCRAAFGSTAMMVADAVPTVDYGRLPVSTELLRDADQAFRDLATETVESTITERDRSEADKKLADFRLLQARQHVVSHAQRIVFGPRDYRREARGAADQALDERSALVGSAGTGEPSWANAQELSEPVSAFRRISSDSEGVLDAVRKMDLEVVVRLQAAMEDSVQNLIRTVEDARNAEA